MERLTLEKLKAPRGLVFVETLYGGSVGLRRLTIQELSDIQSGSPGPSASPHEHLPTNRALVALSVAEPSLDDDAMLALEQDARAFLDLIEKILDLNGLSPKAAKEAARADQATFRAGDPGSQGTPAGS